MTRIRPTRAIVDLDAVRANVARLREIAATEVCAVVKADGYGHGAVAVARAALAGGASWLAVALVEEGLTLRDAGIDAPVLVLSEPPVAAASAVLEAELTPAVYRSATVAALDAAAARLGRRIAVHAKVDTGMGRVGATREQWPERCRELAASRHLDVEAVWTHLARADEAGAATTADQLASFDAALAEAEAQGVRPRLVHTANTAGTLCHPAARRDLVRPGIGIYGLSPGADVDAADHGLVPALSLVSEVSFVKTVAAGTALSYGHRFAAPSDGWVATVPIGYADGVPRLLTGRMEVLLGGQRRPVVGTITMDQLLVWCGTDEPAVGDEVVLLGTQGDHELRAEEWADTLGTITYEITSQLTARVPREVRSGAPHVWGDSGAPHVWGDSGAPHVWGD